MKIHITIPAHLADRLPETARERNRIFAEFVETLSARPQLPKPPRWNWRPFEEQKKWVQKNLVPLGIDTHRKFWVYRMGRAFPDAPPLPPDIVRDPRNQPEFEGWPEYFGRPRLKPNPAFPSYEEAAAIVRAAGLTNLPQYWKFMNETKTVLPRNPAIYYKGKGWAGTHAFFQKRKKYGPK